MCGIAGGISRSNSFDIRPYVERLSKLQEHRGPDEEGTYFHENVGLGHRRLSIIDLSTGQQPMFDISGRFGITYNGELYNFLDLKKQLEGKGHSFKTSSDTEVIVVAYKEWGPECVKRFRGMYAFAVADFQDKTLFLARDPLGIKPLFYQQSLSLFSFASEIRALKKSSPDILDVDIQAIDEYLFYDFIAPPRSAFVQIRKLPPGSAMLVSFDGSILRSPYSFWNFKYQPDYTRTQEEWEEELDYTIRKSVEAHLVSDVTFGAFLSGGIDSSCVVAYMSELMSQPVETFSIGFDVASVDESKYSSFVAEQFGTKHHLFTSKPNTLALMPQLVEQYGEPICAPSAFPMYNLCQMASEKTKMVLSGDGADEIFTGYLRYFDWMHWIDSMTDGKHSRLSDIPSSTLFDKWVSYHTCIPTDYRSKLWGGNWAAICDEQQFAMRKQFFETEGLDPLHRVQHVDVCSYLPKVLIKADMMGMMNGLEVRTPLTDIRVYELASMMPSSMTLERDESNQYRGKSVFKKILRKYFPQDFLHRKKMGFKVPIDEWMNADIQNQKYLEERLKSPSSALTKLFPFNELASVVEVCRGRQIWSLLFLEQWLKTL